MTRLALAGLFAVFGVGVAVAWHHDVDAARSDRFWRLFQVSGVPAEWYGTLDEMAQQSEVIVIGTITSVQPGRTFGDQRPELPFPPESQVHFASATVAVHRVLAGSVDDSSITLELLVPDQRMIGAVIQSRPDEESIFFLRNKGTAAAAAGRPVTIVRRDAPYWRRVSPQGVLRNLNGAVGIPPDVDGDELGFLSGLEGRPFNQVVHALEAAPSP